MQLETIDWIIIGLFFAVSLAIGLFTMKRASSDATEFFLSGRTMPWWLLGVSMVATTFSADTPNLVADLVRTNGVAGNWAWWAFLLTGMLTVFVYARLWRRSEVLTDIEFYELRYSGKEAAFLRGFRAIYLGVFFNVVIMATVCLAAVKIGNVLLGLPPWKTLLLASVVTVIYSALGGLRGVLITDFVQFILAMIGSVGAAYYILNLPEVGGIATLIEHPMVADKISLIPDFSNTDLAIGLFIIPLAVQWWSVWYPGAEPGGGGYIAQRMLAAKDENNAIGATLLFNIAHYALRPWPWILIALASLVVYPSVDSIQSAFPQVDAALIKNDLAYPAMLTYLPAGLLGLVVASLVAAFMSTISTHLNWGSSYVVNDFWVRFVRPQASAREQVNIGRITTVLLMLASAVLSLFIGSAKDGFNVLLQIGAGTGLIFILRWFWWRINAYTELAGMVISFVYALAILFIAPEWSDGLKLIVGVGITTIGWLVVTFLTPPVNTATLTNYAIKVKPWGAKWKELSGNTVSSGDKLPRQIVAMLLGVVLVYACLFGIGKWLYGQMNVALLLFAIAGAAGLVIYKMWKSEKN